MSGLYKTSSVHTHTTFCDGKNTPAEMAASACEQGLRTLGFSGHMFTPGDTSYCMTEEKTAQYCREIEQLKKQYAGRLDVLRGVEYDPMAVGVPQGYDYWIGSVHALRGEENGKLYAVDLSTDTMLECLREGFGGDWKRMVRAYYGQVLAVAEKKPTILGHFDLIVKTNRGGCLFDESSREYLNIALEMLDACLEQQVCFEMNTGAIWRKWRTEAYPDDVLLRRLAEKKAAVTITADAHETGALVFGYDRCAERARAAGLRSLLVMTGGGFAEEAL